MSKKTKVYAVDFDGTLCQDAFPGIGEPRHEIIDFVKFKQSKGDKLILWTCRTADRLQAAVDWCAGHGLVFDAVNENLPERIERFGTDPRKIGADVYLDDKAMVPELSSLFLDVFN